MAREFREREIQDDNRLLVRSHQHFLQRQMAELNLLNDDDDDI